MRKRRSNRSQQPRAEVARPLAIVLGGCNGAGKSTSAPGLLRDFLNVTEFVNADTIATGLSGFHPEGVALAAGEVMLRRLQSLEESRTSFACETTLAGRSIAARLRNLGLAGYVSHLIFLWLPSVDLAVARVKARVEAGGHSIPEETIRRRYYRGIHNFFRLYRPIVDAWRVYNNSRIGEPRLIASGFKDGTELVIDETDWQKFKASATVV